VSRMKCFPPLTRLFVPAAVLLAAYIPNESYSQTIPLAPATPVDVTPRVGRASGEVSSGHAVFTFDVSTSSVVSIGVDVTEVREGGPLVSNDTQLFLFGPAGHLLAFNDDVDPFETEFESLIEGHALAAGKYYVGVTTFDNDPLLDASNAIVGWLDNGKSNVAFELTIGFRTPPGDFDANGRVDGNDFLAWQRDLGATGTNLRSDANGNGIVDVGDLNVWRGQFGQLVRSAAAVPEPPCTVLLLPIALYLGVGLERCRGLF
jgi:hypothetical protein